MKAYFNKYILIASIGILLTNHDVLGQYEKGGIQMGMVGVPIIYFNGDQPTGYASRINVGYFPLENMVVGVMIHSGNVADISFFGVGVYSRYYFGENRLNFFVEGSISVGSLKYGSTPEFDGTMRAFTAGGGISYALNKRLSLEIILAYGNMKNMDFPESTQAGNTFIPAFGIKYLF